MMRECGQRCFPRPLDEQRVLAGQVSYEKAWVLEREHAFIEGRGLRPAAAAAAAVRPLRAAHIFGPPTGVAEVLVDDGIVRVHQRS